MKTRLILTTALALVLVLIGSIAPAQAALPTNLSWIKEATNPVVPTAGVCYSGAHVDPALVIESPGNYKMYFSRAGNEATDIFLATTTNGGLNWTCANSDNPVLTRGGGSAWDAFSVSSATVVKVGASDYRMWYSGRDVAATTAVYAIGYATSTDGINWLKYGSTPVLTKGSSSTWDSQYIREPSVLNVGGTYHMWYSGTAKWPYFRIGHATSPDGFTWTKDANPVLTPTAGAWDANEVYAPSVVENGGAYEMFYSGNAGGRWVTGHATAGTPSGTWTKDANAILSPDSTGWEFGGDSADYVGAILDGSTWKVFYSSGGGGYAIGLMTLTNQAELTFNQLVGALGVGNTKVVKIDVNNVTDLYGYQFEVHYDKTKVHATAAFENLFFDTTPPATVPPAYAAICDDLVGVCKFASSKVAPTAPSTGSGTLAQITFTGFAPGDSPITFMDNFLTQVGAVPITHAATTGFLTVFGTTTVNGTVQMQGRTGVQIDAGTVTIYDKYGYAPPTIVPFNAGTGSYTANVQIYPDSTTFDIEASHSLYLTNRLTGITLTNGVPYTAATTTLRGGDADNSGKIGIQDVTCIGAAFGGIGLSCGATGNSDITNNGIVNIFDLVLAGGNYDLASPQPW